MKSSGNMIPLEDALKLIDERTPLISRPPESVAVGDALGRTLAAPAISALDLPPFDKAAVDGYAIPKTEGGIYRLVGNVRAGQVCAAALGDDKCVKVMTGAPVPRGASAVVMLEKACEKNGIVKISKGDIGARNICSKSEDVKSGEIAIEAGITLDAVRIGHLTACGVTEVSAAPRVRAAIISTGDELVDDPHQIRQGKIMNSNGPMLAALCTENGLDVTLEARVRDAESETFRIIETALGVSDLVLLSGGVSAGDCDHVPDALTRAGLNIHFDRVAVKPGKPATFATGGGKAVIGLPGNPVAVYIMFHLMAMRAVARLISAAHSSLTVSARFVGDFARKSAGRAEFLPVSIRDDGKLTPIDYHGSAHLGAAARADGFAFIPAGVSAVSAGEPVRLYILGRKRR